MSELEIGSEYVDTTRSGARCRLNDIDRYSVYVQKLVDGEPVGYEFVKFSKDAFQKYWEPADV